LATMVYQGDGGVQETPLEGAKWSARRVPVCLLSDEARVLAVIESAHQAGAACAWVRNTVDDCIAAAELLRARGIEPLVFHARFSQVDRQAREAMITECFGKNSSGDVRRKVLVATQVIEQSLDLDFDAMVSDVAPIDLLIQRAGRLWRHPHRQRPPGVECELVVFAPPFDPAPEENWLKSFLPGTNAVYKNVGVIWRTVRALDQAKEIVTPGVNGEIGGIRWFVESVYDDEADVPSNLERQVGRAEGDALAASATAIQTTLKAADGYHGGAQAWISDMRVRTRLGDEPTVIRLASVSESGELRPWADDGMMPVGRAWALSEVRVSPRRVPFDAAVSDAFEARARSVRATWGRFEQTIALLPLIPEGPDSWRGELVRGGGDIIPVQYSIAHGLMMPRV
jgi:CRISPR-associated endonuclease/helicase Cas3